MRNNTTIIFTKGIQNSLIQDKNCHNTSDLMATFYWFCLVSATGWYWQTVTKTNVYIFINGYLTKKKSNLPSKFKSITTAKMPSFRNFISVTRWIEKCLWRNHPFLKEPSIFKPPFLAEQLIPLIQQSLAIKIIILQVPIFIHIISTDFLK